MDGYGIPLAFNISAGNTNEQGTPTPTEEKILKDFELSKILILYKNYFYADKAQSAYTSVYFALKIVEIWAIVVINE